MINNLSIKIFSDGADLNDIRKMNNANYISGITTNPTLMKLAGIQNYKKFSLEVLKSVTKKPISFEVFDDNLDLMYQQAKVISSWGKNIFVKLPITNTKGEFIGPIAKKLSDEGIKLNITAVFTEKQIIEILKFLNKNVKTIISVFAGRIADTGIDPIKVMGSCKDILSRYDNIELLWASPREVLNIYQADAIGCDIITVTSDLIKKLSLYKKNLDEYSLETVKMFYNDARSSNFKIDLK